MNSDTDSHWEEMEFSFSSRQIFGCEIFEEQRCELNKHQKMIHWFSEILHVSYVVKDLFLPALFT